MARQIGLEDFHIAKITTDTASETIYETPKMLERAVKAKISPKQSTQNFYSNNSMEGQAVVFDSVEVEIELNQLSLESRALLQGATVVKGALIEKSTDIAPVVGLGFKSKKADGEYRYVWLYKGRFEITEDENETSSSSINAKTATLKGTFYPRQSDKAWRLIADTDIVDVDTTMITNWFTAVQNQPTAA